MRVGDVTPVEKEPLVSLLVTLVELPPYWEFVEGYGILAAMLRSY